MDSIKIPLKGKKHSDVLKEMKSFGKDDPDYKKGKAWSLVYYLNKKHTDFLHKAHEEYFSANGLNPMAFKSLKRFESEVVRMTADLLNGDENVMGAMTAGGTESCMLAVKTYRDYARKHKPWIRKPEMVIPETAHVAWLKGAEYFNVKAIRVPLEKDYSLDPEKVRKKINRKTIMLLGSAPEYPHGTIDPIKQLGEIAVAKKIPLHVDACVGGYLLPFLEKLDYDIPEWDFRVPGVTSISADTHKYGYSAKGASTILYRSVDYFKHQLFIFTEWSGGIFASPALLGTRPGGSIAAAWAALQAIGVDGYIENAKKIMEAVKTLKDGLASIPEIEIVGKPQMSLLAYQSISKDLNIYAVGDYMEEKGWHIDRQQKPECLHAMVTPQHVAVADKYISDLKEAVVYVKAHPELGDKGNAAMYGMIANIPMRGMIKKNVEKIMLDMYKPVAKFNTDISISGEDSEQDLAEKAALFYIKLKKKFSKK